MDVCPMVNQEQKDKLLSLLGIDSGLSTSEHVPHVEGGHLVVGEKYEMYAPAAKGSAANLGIIWHDTVHYAFTYAGTISMRGELYVCTKDIHYEAGGVVPDAVLAQFKVLAALIEGAQPLCPAYVIGKIVRPYTGE